ncbi:hypothetical protein AMES_1747 [Amycolatopsis mediterranei S699]|uniref:Uncharacterized protein n=2 Tax=Amycolatopsis mediterranei TaxID=33910 RepID=A0A0H3D238_AMYMU|nr:hypothetical protein [Amycolatopsis mediterranei]ADJ43571.1 hypothetical protein AMED_1760 [Amycolatopsis mediterranei U32]AEK40277.1 hypothetical protein RAM_08935 [Amycolatopsis mediterranei S699]AFO75283.1 hypothetical protein AMES_1747 [Amycolatopsis mediterranei S699]AGT82412.1 hypothetical protein B737_1748 [Amycolatopsis mediterranei RB]KDO03770.1 hypothetical protein DV26_47190 [Amycolatopsis mediterranei]
MPGFPLELRPPSFDLAELVGRKTDEATARCERDGFQVQVFDIEKPSAVTLELRRNRIRLHVRRGVVEDCHQG